MTDRKADEHLADWQAADRAEAGTVVGSVERRRAVAKTRRARYGFEDAARAVTEDEGGAPETGGAHTARTLQRLQEAVDGAAELQPGTARRGPEPEDEGQRDKRLADEAEVARELDE